MIEEEFFTRIVEVCVGLELKHSTSAKLRTVKGRTYTRYRVYIRKGELKRVAPLLASSRKRERLLGKVER